MIVACAQLLGIVFGAGMHLHVVLSHEHGDDGAHRHVVALHAHSAGRDIAGGSSIRQPAGEHRHHVPQVQIVALQPAPVQHGSVGLEESAAVALAVMPVQPDSGSEHEPLPFHGTSPPSKPDLIEEISGRSPPLL